MNILSIETSTQVCSVALTEKDRLLIHRIHQEGSNHAALLPIFVNEILAYAREQNIHIDAISISEGPGSYTGLRIGTSIAKGLAYGLGCELIPVPTLAILAEAARQQIDNNVALFCPMVDARRMEVYTQIYDDNLKPINKVEARVVENNEWLRAIGKEIYFFGDGASKCRNLLECESIHYLDNIIVDAKYMHILALNTSARADIAYYIPFYLKDFQAAPSHIKGLDI